MSKFLVLFLLFACSSSPVKLTNESLETLAKRENALKEKFDMKSEDGALKFKVRAQSAPKVGLVKEQVEYHYVTINIGSDVPVECTFYRHEIGPASTLKKLSQTFLGRSDLIGEIKDQRVSFIDAGQISGQPYLQLNTVYTTKLKGYTVKGLLKAVVAIKGRDSVLCMHNEVGYLETFKSVVDDVVSSFNYKTTPDQAFHPAYTDISIYKVQEHPIGFEVKYVLPGQQDTTVMIIKSSSLIPSSASDVTTADDSQVEVSQDDGILSMGRYVSEHNGNINYALDLNQQNGRSYYVKGLYKEKDIGHFIKSQGLVSNYQEYKTVAKEFAQGKKKETSISGYFPDINPEGATQIHFQLKESQEQSLTVESKVGKFTRLDQIDRNGVVKATTITADEAKFEGHQIFESGSF